MSKLSDTIAYLDALGLSHDLDSFASRKRIQKSIYLLKTLGANLRFGYTWYIHGPYSPELTRTLLDPPREEVRNVRNLGKEELEIVNLFRSFLENDFYSVDSLELVVSLLYLIRHGPEEDLDTKRKIVDYFLLKKPQFSPDEVEYAWRKLEGAGLWKADFRRLHS